MERLVWRNKKEFERHFRREVLPHIRKLEAEYGGKISVDTIMRREEWLNYIDSLVKGGELPQKAVDWACPW